MTKSASFDVQNQQGARRGSQFRESGMRIRDNTWFQGCVFIGGATWGCQLFFLMRKPQTSESCLSPASTFSAIHGRRCAVAICRTSAVSADTVVVGPGSGVAAVSPPVSNEGEIPRPSATRDLSLYFLNYHGP